MADLKRDAVVGLKIEGAEKVESVLKNVDKSVDKLSNSNNQAAQATDNLKNKLHDLNKETAVSKLSFGNLFNSIFNVKNLFFSFLGIFGGRQLLNLSDDIKNINSRLALTIPTIDEQKRVYGELLVIANRTGASLQATADGFTKIQLATRMSSDEVLSFQDTLQKMAVIGGTSGAQLSAAMMQLTQGMSSGQLAGDELRSVLENFPLLAQKLADGFGVSTGELRKFAAAGRAILPDEIVKIVSANAAIIDEDFKKIGVTFARVTTVLGNNFTDLIGNIDAAAGVSDAFVVIIQSVADGVKILGGWIKSLSAEQIRQIKFAFEQLFLVLGSILGLKFFALLVAGFNLIMARGVLAINGLIASFVNLRAAMIAGTAGLSGFTAALGATRIAVLALGRALIIPAIITALVEIIYYWDEIIKKIRGAITATKEFFGFKERDMTDVQAEKTTTTRRGGAAPVGLSDKNEADMSFKTTKIRQSGTVMADNGDKGEAEKPNKNISRADGQEPKLPPRNLYIEYYNNLKSDLLRANNDKLGILDEQYNKELTGLRESLAKQELTQEQFDNLLVMLKQRHVSGINEINNEAHTNWLNGEIAYMEARKKQAEAELVFEKEIEGIKTAGRTNFYNTEGEKLLAFYNNQLNEISKFESDKALRLLEFRQNGIISQEQFENALTELTRSGEQMRANLVSESIQKTKEVVELARLENLTREQADLEKENADFEMKMSLLQARLMIEGEMYRNFYADKEALTQAHEKKKAAIEMAAYAANVNGARGIFSDLAGIYTGGNKTLQGIVKVAKIAEIGAALAIEPALAYSRAVAQYGVPLGPVLGGISAAAVTARLVSGLAQLRSMAGGGVVGQDGARNIASVDKYPTMLAENEVVSNSRQQANLLNAIANGGAVSGGEKTINTNISVELDGAVIARAVARENLING